MDDLDRKILIELQRDATAALDDVAKKVGSSKTPVWNRIRKMREAGIIEKTVAIVNPEAVGLGSTFYVLVKTSQHEKDWLEKFVAAVNGHPEIVSAHRLAGEIDYILKVQVADAKAFDAFYQALIADVSIFNVTSLMSMEQIKTTTELPL